MRFPRHLGKLASLVTLLWVWVTPSLLLSGLVAVPASSCCDCAGDFNNLRVGSSGESSADMSGLDVSGDGCGEVHCGWQVQGGACRRFVVRLVMPGTCHLVATATDGRQAATDVTVQIEKTTCCGDIYTTGRQDDEGHGGGLREHDVHRCRSGRRCLRSVDGLPPFSELRKLAGRPRTDSLIALGHA